MGLDAQQMPLAEVFTGDRQYAIPLFQRPYSWEFDDAYQLADDLIAAWRRNDEAYFLGSIVLVRGQDSRGVEVIDGQQRLTTLSLLFAVLREMISDGSSARNEIAALLEIPANSILGVSQRPRLKLRERDQSFFANYIVKGDLLGLSESAPEQRGNDAVKHLRENVEAIQECLNEALPLDEELDFLRYLLQQVQLVVVETDNYVSAHRIFGVLNTRGRPLAAADIFKARVLGTVPAESQDVYADLWDGVIDLVGAEPDAFFRHLLICLTQNPTKRALIEEFGTYLNRYEPDRGEEFIDKVLKPFGEAYWKISEGVSNMTTAERRAVSLLMDHLSEDWKPVVMWALASIPESGVRSGVLEKFERYYSVMVFAGLSSDERSTAIVRVLRELVDQSQMQELGSAPLREMSLSDKLRLRTVFALTTEVKKTQVFRKAILTRAYIAAGGEVEALPRSYSAMSLLPNDVSNDPDVMVDTEFWHNRLGSLVLVQGRVKTSVHNKPCRVIDTFVRENSISQGLPPVLPFSALPVTHDVIAERHSKVVRLVARYLDIERDSEGIVLTALSEQDLSRLLGGYGLARSRRIRLADVQRVGLVAAGDVFVWRRPNKGDEFRITVTSSGLFQLPDGREVETASTAVTELTGSSAQALDVWVRESDGKKLRSIWDTYERRFGH